MADYRIDDTIREAMAARWNDMSSRWWGLRPLAKPDGADHSQFSVWAEQILAHEVVQVAFRSLPPEVRRAVRSTESYSEYDRIRIGPDGSITKLPENMIARNGPAGLLYQPHGPGRRGKGRKKR